MAGRGERDEGYRKSGRESHRAVPYRAAPQPRGVVYTHGFSLLSYLGV